MIYRRFEVQEIKSPSQPWGGAYRGQERFSRVTLKQQSETTSCQARQTLLNYIIQCAKKIQYVFYYTSQFLVPKVKINCSPPGAFLNWEFHGTTIEMRISNSDLDACGFSPSEWKQFTVAALNIENTANYGNIRHIPQNFTFV